MATYNGHQEDSSGNILLSIGNGMTATLETGSTASQAYTKGAYLFFNNKLCKASTSITSGTTLAIGTNLTQTTIGAELTSHLIAANGDEFYFDYKDGVAGYYPNASKTASQFVPFGGVMSMLGSVSKTVGNVGTTQNVDITLNKAVSSVDNIVVVLGKTGIGSKTTGESLYASAASSGGGESRYLWISGYTLNASGTTLTVTLSYDSYTNHAITFRFSIEVWG